MQGGDNMNQNEHANVIIGLREISWSDEKINDFMLYVETGDKTYLDQAKQKQ